MSERPDPLDDELLGRIARGVSGITPRADSAFTVHRVVARRRRRRAVTTAVAAAAAVVVVGAGSAVVLHGLDGGHGPGPATSDSDSPRAFDDGRYVPAVFFAAVVGGTAFPTVVQHHASVGERLVAQLTWNPDGVLDATPDPGSPDPGSQDPDSQGHKVPVAIALERTRLSPAAACAALVVDGAAPSCQQRSDGAVLATFAVPLADAVLDPVHHRLAFVVPGQGRNPVDATDPDAVVRGVTYVRPDGLVVSVSVCRCPTTKDPDPADPPVSDAELERVAADGSWVNR